MFGLLAHLIFPSEANNQKAKLLHSSALLAVTLVFVFYQFSLNLAVGINPGVLGFAASIPPSSIVKFTNEKRVANGLSPLVENSALSAAARKKGEEMLAKDYWAHVAPDGTEPWKFFTDAGYKYRYAGENLARDFSSPESAVEAWMASESHRENLLSGKYKEIGIGVVEGDLGGVDTTIIVQFFGTKYATPVSVTSKSTEGVYDIAVSTGEENALPAEAETSPGFSLSYFLATKWVALAFVLGLLAVMVVDVFFVAHRGIVRIGSRTLANISFLGMILTILIIAKSGQII